MTPRRTPTPPAAEATVEVPVAVPSDLQRADALQRGLRTALWALLASAYVDIVPELVGYLDGDGPISWAALLKAVLRCALEFGLTVAGRYIAPPAWPTPTPGAAGAARLGYVARLAAVVLLLLVLGLLL